MRKILLITPAINMGGMQRAMVTLANGLVQSGIDIEMHALFRLEHFLKLNPSIKFSEPNYSPTHFNPITRIFHVVKEIRKVMKSSDATSIIVYGKFYSALALFASIGLKKRIFISDRASPLYRDFWYVELLTKLIYFFIKPYGVIAQTTVSAEYQRKRFGNDIYLKVIPNAVRKIKRYDYPKENVILAVGRFGDKLKGFDRLIEAWALVDAPSWKLRFVGGSENEAPDFVKRINELNIHDRIEFLGKVQNVDEQYSKGAIFVIPSRSEGFPNALAEAMTAGMCCVSFDFTAGPKDMITNGKDGIIVEEGNITLLAKAIQDLIDHPKQREYLASNALKSSIRFESSRICDEIINFVFS